jgi:hypothetical protein
MIQGTPIVPFTWISPQTQRVNSKDSTRRWLLYVLLEGAFFPSPLFSSERQPYFPAENAIESDRCLPDRRADDKARRLLYYRDFPESGGDSG